MTDAAHARGSFGAFRVSLLLALRYMRVPSPRSFWLYLIPLALLLQLGVLRAIDYVVAHAQPAAGAFLSARPLLVATGATFALAYVLSLAFWVTTLGRRDRGSPLLLPLRALGALLITCVAGPTGFVTVLCALVFAPRSRMLRAGLLLAYAACFVLAPFAMKLLASSPEVLSLHAEWSRAIGTAEWALSVAAALLFVLMVVLRHLTIFTTISTYGMFLGCAALVVVLSVMSGFEADIKHKILGTHAHVVVTRPDEAFTDWAAKLPEVKKMRGVAGVSPYLSAEAMIASPGNRSNVIVKGIDPDTVGQVTDLSHDIEIGELDALAHPEKIRPPDELPMDEDLRIDGHKEAAHHGAAREPDGRDLLIAHKAPPGIIVGRELARTLRVYLGDDVSLVSPTGGIGPSGSVPKARPYRVAAIFYSGMFEYDSKFVYLKLPSAQKLFDQTDEVTGLEIKVPDPEHTDDVMLALGKVLGPGYEVADWKSLNRSLFSALALEKVVMFVFLSFIILVAAFSIVANGQMIATQKTSEIAILKAMGAEDGTIAGAFFLLGSLLGGIGVLAGVGGGLLGAFALRHWGYALDPDVFYLTQLPVRLETPEILTVALAGILVTILATVQPAWVASRMTPVEGLRAGGR